jgi:hypothetical protein
VTLLALVALAGAVPTSPAIAAEPASPTPTAATPKSGQPTRAEISAAIARLKADPNLGTEKKTSQLRRNTSRDTPHPPGGKPGWLKWIADAFGWFADTARVLVWILAIILVGVLGILIKRFLESRAGMRSSPLRFNDAAPTHVRDLDIRPESLPDDIGRAALDLWERGEHRAAMALLYRGLLSRLAHVHGAPIRDSSTEGDCLALATAHLPVERAAYTGMLIRAWQRAVYGNTEPSVEEIQTLCAGFGAAIDAPPPPTEPLEKAA